MKRFAFVALILLLLGGCAPQGAAALPRLRADVQPAALAEELWAALGTEAAPQPLDAETACLVLGLRQSDLAGAYGYFDPARPQQAQLFLLHAAEGRQQKVRRALEAQLDLVRQTAAAMEPQEEQPEDWGCVLAAGEWCALVVPAAEAHETTAQAAEVFHAAFDQ